MDEEAREIDEAERRRVEAEFLERVQEEMRQVTVEDYLLHLLPVLSSMAFQHLGLTQDSAGDRDLGQSRLAIDAFGALTEVLAATRSEDEIQLYRSTLHQMRMAFVTASGGVPQVVADDQEPADGAVGDDEPGADTPEEA